MDNIEYSTMFLSFNIWKNWYYWNITLFLEFGTGFESFLEPKNQIMTGSENAAHNKHFSMQFKRVQLRSMYCTGGPGYRFIYKVFQCMKGKCNL